MRDGILYAAFRDLDRKIGSDVGMMLRSIGIVETRQRALEQMLFGKRFSLISSILIQIVSPKLAQATLARIHGMMLKDHHAKLKEAIEEKNKKIKPVSPPAMGVIKLGAFAWMLLVSGCVSASKYNRVQEQNAKLSIEYTKAVTERDIAAKTANYCTEQQVKLVDVLQKFNQVDSKGQLYKGKK